MSKIARRVVIETALENARRHGVGGSYYSHEASRMEHLCAIGHLEAASGEPHDAGYESVMAEALALSNFVPADWSPVVNEGFLTRIEAWIEEAESTWERRVRFVDACYAWLTVDEERKLAAMEALHQLDEEAGMSDLTPDEVIADIAAARAERRKPTP